MIGRFQGDLAKQSRVPRVAERFTGQGLTVRVSAPQEFSKYLTEELARWQQVVNAAGIQKQ